PQHHHHRPPCFQRRPLSAAAALPAVIALLALLVLTLTSLGFAQPRLEPYDPPRGDQRIVVFGDFNGPYGSLDYPAPVANVLSAITDFWRPDLLLSPGDVIAGQSRELPGARLQQMWRAFDQAVAAKLRAAEVPYAFAMGNHDGSSLAGAGAAYLFERDREAAAEYWGQEMYRTNLAYVDRRGFPFDYAFRAGGAFVAVIDASSASVSGAQRRWLAATLSTPEARAAELRIVVGHLPLVAVGEGRDGPGEVITDTQGLIALFEENSVDLYISGHHAAYYPGRLGELELLFAGGVGARRLLGDDGPPRSTVTLIDVWYEPLRLTYSTFDASTLELVAPESLPPELASGVRLSTRAGPAVADASR
ncbi:MAG TPA: metallophosphoesterase, partial [Trueperaceae bacterium]|nr:metallophosphoesterase [Trueperaceae bacterium]